MDYKENKEMLFKEKFHTLDISTTTPDDLKKHLGGWQSYFICYHL